MICFILSRKEHIALIVEHGRMDIREEEAGEWITKRTQT